MDDDMARARALVPRQRDRYEIEDFLYRLKVETPPPGTPDRAACMICAAVEVGVIPHRDRYERRMRS